MVRVTGMRLNHIQASVNSYHSTARSHFHEEFAQLIFPLEGNLHLELDQAAIDISNQDLYYVPPNHLHTFYSNAMLNKSLVLNIPVSFLNETASYKQVIHQRIDETWFAIRQLLIKEANAFNHHSLRSLCGYVSQQLLPQQEARSILYIHHHLHTELSIQTLAQIECYNPNYYIEWFKKRTGKSPHDYIKDLRLKKATELLKESNLSLLEISLEVGFQNQGTLSRLFKKRFGVTPRAYRRSSEF